MKLIVVKHLDRTSVLEVKVVVFHVCSEWEYMSRVSSLTFPTMPNTAKYSQRDRLERKPPDHLPKYYLALITLSPSHYKGVLRKRDTGHANFSAGDDPIRVRGEEGGKDHVTVQFDRQVG